MKKIISFLFGTLFLVTIIPCLSFGQDTQITLTRSILLNGDSEKEEITIKVEEQVVRLNISIKSSINKGKLILEIYDPNGEKEGYFSIGGQIKAVDNKKEIVTGSINKMLQEPTPGNWKIIIIPNKAKGSIKINTNKSL